MTDRSAVQPLPIKKTIAMRAALIGINVVYIVTLARLLGAQEYGRLAVALGVAIVFLTISFAGANWRLAVEIGRNLNAVGSIAGRYVKVRLLTVGIAVLACLGWAGFMVQPPDQALLLALFAVTLVPRSLATLYGAVQIGTGRSDRAISCELVGRIAEIAIIITILNGNIAGILAVPLVQFFTWSMQAMWLRAKGPALSFELGFGQAVKSVLPGALPYAALGAGMAWLQQSALIAAPDLTEPDAFLGASAIAVAAMAAGLALLNSLSAPYLPVLARSEDAQNSHGTRFAIGACALAAAGGLICFSFLSEAGRPILSALVGEGFAGLANNASAFALMIGAHAWLVLICTLASVRERVWSAAVPVLLAIPAVWFLARALAIEVAEIAPVIASTAGAGLAALVLTCSYLLRRAQPEIYAKPLLLVIGTIAAPFIAGSFWSWSTVLVATAGAAVLSAMAFSNLRRIS